MFKILKQELVFIPIMFVLIEALRWALCSYFPETALFDKGSELESFFFSAWQMVWITSASLLLLYVVFPPAFKTFKVFYLTFETKEQDTKEGFSILFYLCFFFGLIFLVSGRAATPTNESFIRKKLVDTIHTQLHVRELTGLNDGVEVEKYLTFVGRYKGDSWCAAFTSWNLNAVGVTSPPNPKSGWSPNFSTKPYTIWSLDLVKKHKAKTVQPGDCFTLYYPSLGRVGHVGFIVDETNNYFITIEGNTGLTGSRDGSGVHKYKRSKSKVYRVTNYITPYLTNHEKTVFNTIRNINDSDNVVHTKINRINTENNRCYKDNNPREGFNFLQGFNLPYQSGQFKNSGYYKSGTEWRDQLTRNYNRDTINQTFCRNKEGENSLNLPMQRFRDSTQTKRTAYTEALYRKLAKAGYKIRIKNSSGTVRSKMG